MASIRVLIADDHRLFAEALEAILAGDERIEVVGHARRRRGGRRARATAPSPTSSLMDISMPVMDGIEAAQRDPRSSTGTPAILMLTGSNARADVDRARQAGATGYVTKDPIAAELDRRDPRDRCALATLAARASASPQSSRSLVSVALLALILMHSGRDAGMGGMGFTPASQGGTHIVERNLTRLRWSSRRCSSSTASSCTACSLARPATLHRPRAGGGIGRRARLRALWP